MINLILKEIIRDLSRRKLRTLGVIITISIALSLLPLVRNMEASTKASFNAVAEEYAKPDIIVKADKGLIPDNLSSTIKGVEGVLLAEPRLIVEGFSIVGEENIIVSVQGTPPNPEINKIKDMMTPWSHFNGSVAIVDRKTAELAGIDVGDNLTVVTNNGTLNFTIIATADASWSYTPRIPRVVTLIVPLKYLQGVLNVEGEVNYYYVKAVEDSDLKQLSKDLEKELFKLGYDVKVEPAPIPSSPHGNVASIFSIVMIPSALIALVLIASILMNKVASEFRYLGVRKALGFTPRDIMVFVLLYSVILYLISVPIGLVMSYATTYVSANMIMERVIPFVVVRIDIISVLRYLLYGFFATIIFSLYPAYQAAKTNTLYAIQWGFEPQKYSKSTKEARLPKILAMAVRNVTRRRRRSALIVLILILGGAFVVDAEVIRNSVVKSYSSGLVEQNKFDLQVFYSEPFNNSLIENVSKIQGVESVEGLGVKYIHRENLTFSINDKNIDIEPFSNPVILFINKPLKLYTPEVIKGRFPGNKGEVLISQYIHLTFGVEIGDKIIIGDENEDWFIEAEVVGIGRLLQQRGWEFIFSIKDAYSAGLLPTNTYNSILVKIKSGYDVGKVTNEVVERTQEFGPENAILTETIKEAGATIIKVLEGFMMAVTFIIIISALIGLVISFQMAFYERKWEIGLLKTLGGVNKDITKLFVYEAMIYALIATPIAIILGYFTSNILVETLNTIDLFLGVKPFMPQIEWITLLLFPLTVTLIATIPTVKSALKIVPAQLLRESNM